MIDLKHGVEQEIQVVNENGHLVYEVPKILDKVPDKYYEFGKGGIYKDKYQSQLEIATDTCETLEELEEQLIELREVVNEAARECDLFLIGTAANPHTKGRVGEYFAEQHHIDANSDKRKLRLNNFLRIFVPEIFALSSNSPIHDNHITKWKSVRASMDTYDPSKRVNPNIKPAPYLNEEDIKRGYLSCFEYENSYEEKRKKSRYYDLSPFTQKCKASDEYKPTLEIRLLDTHPYIPLTVAYAALFRTLTVKLDKVKWVPNINIGHNRNKAIKNGMSSSFFIKRDMKRCFHYKNVSDSSTIEVIKAFFDWLKPEIKEMGYEKQIKPLKRFLKHKRNLADWQIHLFSKKKDQYVSELFGATMEDYEKKPLPESKIKFKFVEKEEVRKEIEWDEDIKEAYEMLEKAIQHSYTISYKEYANSLLALKKCNPTMEKIRCEEMVNTLLKKYSGSKFYHTLLLLETLFIYEETEREIYRQNAKKVMDQLRGGILEDEQLWISAYALSVMSKLGGEELEKKELAEKLRNRISEFTPSWVIAYIVECLIISGLDASKELSQLKILLKENHWECKQTDNVKATAIIYDCLNSIGYKNDNVVQWLKRELSNQVGSRKRDIMKLSLNLKALSEEAVK